MMVIILAFTLKVNPASASQITWLINAGISTPITKTIRHLQPKLSWEEANKHAWIIYREAERTGIDWKVIVAVTMQESSFRFMRGDKACGLTPSGAEECVYQAFGPMHVYWRFWKEKLKLNSLQLVYNLEYQYRTGVDILKIRYNRFKHMPNWNWVGTYNSLTKVHIYKYNIRINKHRMKIEKFLLKQIRNANVIT